LGGVEKDKEKERAFTAEDTEYAEECKKE